MAEFFSIPLRNIKKLLLDKRLSSRVRRKLRELQSRLIQIPGIEDRNLNLNQRMNDVVVDFAYKIDDQLDTLFVNVELYGRSVIGSDIASILKKLVSTFQENRALHNINSLIQSFISRRSNNLDTRSPYPILNERQDYYYDIIEERDLVKNTEDLEKLIKLLTDARISPIIDLSGVDGSGKTSLVERIYNDIYIRRHFQAFAWVSLPQSSRGTSYKHINHYHDILKQLLLPNEKKGAVVMPMEEKELVKELRKVLMECKCLVVVDNTKEGDQHQLLDQIIDEIPFERRNNSKVLVASRRKNDQFPVSKASSAAGLNLLVMTAFGADQLIDPTMDEIGKILADKCDFIPLLISIVGRVLSENLFSRDHWIKVRDYILHKYDDDMKAIDSSYKAAYTNWKILALSYDHLPIQLRACFLYLGQFPKDEDIDVEMLYQIWIAEGMVSSDLCVRNETTMDIAEEYLAMLASRLLVHVQECDFSMPRKFVSCRTHIAIKEFCLKPQRELNDFQKSESQQLPKPNSFCDFEYSSQDGRRLSLHFSGQEFLENADIDVNRALGLASDYLRSLLICNANGVWRVQISFPQEIYQKFILLRVLKIENFEIKGGKLPRDIKNLIHLRYFSLKGSAFEELPSSIGNFQFLETLDLRVAEIFPRGIVVPNVLWKLKNSLRHVYLPAFRSMPKGGEKLRFDGLSKLETLVNFDSQKDELTTLGWNSLRHIEARVHGKKNFSYVIDCITNYGHNLKESSILHASFSGCSIEESCVPFVVLKYPRILHLTVSWGRCELNELKTFTYLIELCFMRCQIKEDPMPTLGKFPFLEKLVLGKKTFMGKHMECEPDSFPVLRYLKITNLMHLEKLEIHESSMPDLFCLEIVCCHKLKMIPEGLTRLKELKLSMPKEFNDRVRVEGRNEGEDFYKVRHVPFICLEDWSSQEYKKFQ